MRRKPSRREQRRCVSSFFLVLAVVGSDKSVDEFGIIDPSDRGIGIQDKLLMDERTADNAGSMSLWRGPVNNGGQQRPPFISLDNLRLSSAQTGLFKEKFNLYMERRKPFHKSTLA